MSPRPFSGFPVLLILAGCSLAGGPAPTQGPSESRPRVDLGRGSDSEVPSPPPRSAGERPDGSAAAESRNAPATALLVVETAFESIGTPYRWGGTAEGGYDCSGLIRYAYGQYGIELPRVSRDQLKRGDPVDLRIESLRPGDILGFSAVPGGSATHVGLYVGDGEFIHSSTSGVRISDLRTPYWQQHLIAARRILGG